MSDTAEAIAQARKAVEPDKPKHVLLFTKKNKYDILYIDYKGFIQRIIEVETVLLHTPWVKRNVGKGTPTNNSSLPYIRKSNAIEV